MLKDERGAEGIGGVAFSQEASPPAGRSCSVSGCGGRHLARGYCVRHYYQVKRNGSVRPEGAGVGRRQVPLPGAGRPDRVPFRHAQGERPAFRIARETLCAEESCSETPFSRGLCRLHYIMVRGQDLLS